MDSSERIFVNGVPAAFRGGMHICPMVTPPVPHVGGPIVYNCELEFSEALESSEGYQLCRKNYLEEVEKFVRKIERDAESDIWWYTEGIYQYQVHEIKKDVSRGSTVLEVDGEGIEIGDSVVIGSDPDLSETARVVDKGSLVLDRPLKNSYPAGTLVTRVPDEYAPLVLPPTEEELAITLVDTEPEQETNPKGIPGLPYESILCGLFLVMAYWVIKK